MKIKVGHMVNVEHIGDNGRKKYHPFLIINISTKNIWALQCTSVKEEDNHSYFSSENISFYELKCSDANRLTHVRLDSFEKIVLTNIKSYACDINWEDYKRIAQKMLSTNWTNNAYFNHNEIHNHVKKGKKQFNKEWNI